MLSFESSQEFWAEPLGILNVENVEVLRRDWTYGVIWNTTP